MASSGPTTIRPAAFWARQGVGLATRALPVGDVRDRYRQEFIAELYGMSVQRQAAHTVGVLLHAWSLRAAAAGGQLLDEETKVNSKPLACRLNVHHAWHAYLTAEGDRHLACRRCGKDRAGSGPRDPRQSGPASGHLTEGGQDFLQ